MKEKLIIVGAGISGIYSAYLLKDKYDITIIEARDRVGGRILTINEFDLGASWIWKHQKNILKLIDTLGLKVFEQYNKGYALYDEKRGLKKFLTPEGDISYRIEGGTIKLIDELTKNLDISINLKEKVISTKYINNKLYLETNRGTYNPNKIIFTIPPRLFLEKINFSPEIDFNIKINLNNIATWMAHSSKAIIEFEESFWRNENLSGFVFSTIGPLMEIHDASTNEKNGLLGFLNSKNLFNENNIKNQIDRVFNKEEIKNIYNLDWREEEFTSTKKDLDVNYDYFSYGYDLNLYDDKVHFIGTESNKEEGGYLEGAINSVLNLVKKLN